MQQQDSPKKLFIKTWGCQMNVYDSNRMADILSPFGYKTSDTPEDADMIILNTCHIREKATDKVFSELGRLKEHKDAKKEKGERMLLAVAGCVAQAEGDFIAQRAPFVDMIFGPQTYHELPEMIAKATGSFGHKRVINTEFSTQDKFDTLPEEQITTGPAAFLSIQEGCDKFCTFCVVPYTRGGEYSRPVDQILVEAKKLVDAGVHEISVLGQNVNAYHGEGPDGKTWNLGRLLFALAELGVPRLRYTTSHPRDMHEDLYKAHAEIDTLMPFLHLPVQSGSDRILKLMNRKHSADDYRRIIDRLKTEREDLAFSSDFIIGFPGESEEDHKETLKLVEDVTFSSCYSFKYSPRPGTPGANMGGIVREDIKSRRLQELQELLNEQQYTFNKKSDGLTMPVLFDRRGKKENQLIGRSPWNQSVHVTGNERLMGQLVDVDITSAGPNSLRGEIKTLKTASIL